MASRSIIDELKEKLESIAVEKHLGETSVKVKIGTLTTKQAIGSPKRQDFPLLQGKEVMIEAEFQGSYGQAFTGKPSDFSGSLNDVLELKLNTSENRAIFIATLNAAAAHLNIVNETQHCRDEEPEECAAEIAQYILSESGKTKVGLIGLQPAILENLVMTFGRDNVICTDLNPDNIGIVKYGARIWDGKIDSEKLIKWCDLLLVTSSTMVNGTFDEIQEEAKKQGKRMIVFGVTGAGAAAISGLERVCFKAH